MSSSNAFPLSDHNKKEIIGNRTKGRTEKKVFDRGRREREREKERSAELT